MHFTLLRINFLIIGLFTTSLLSGQVSLNRLFGTYGSETGKSGFVMPDSSIYALGTSSAFPSLSSQLYLVKIDKNGDLVWSKFYGGSGVDDAIDMYVDLETDSSIYMLSNSFINFNKGYDVKVVKADKNGNLLWEKSYGTNDWDIPAKMIKTSSNMLAICGHTYGNTFGLTDGMMLLLDMNGDSLLFKNYGDVDANKFNDLIESGTDSLVFCGEKITIAGMQRAWLFVLDLEMGSSSSKFFGNTYNHTFNSIEKHPNGNYILSSTSDSTEISNTNIYCYLIQKDTLSIILEFTISGPLNQIAVEAKYLNNKYFVLAEINSSGLGGWEAAVFMTYDGSWFPYANTWGTSLDDFGATILQNNNYAFTIIGTSAEEFGPTDLWVVNLDSLLTNVTAIDSQFDINEVHESESTSVAFTVFPNPFSDFIKINSELIPAKIFINDSFGRTVLSLENTSNIDLETLGLGTYFISIIFDDGSIGNTCILKIK